MIGDKPLIKYPYPFGSKCNIYVSEETQIGISKRGLRGIKFFIVGYMELPKIVGLYDSQKYRVFTSRDVEFPESTKCLESTRIKSPTDLPLNLDSDAP
jgi:hypothetical protein